MDTTHSATIAVIDDLPSNRSIVRDMLEEMGFHSIVEFDDGASALQALSIAAPDLIVSDYMMKRMSGYELLSRARLNPTLATVPFIMMSAHSDVQKIEDTLSGGAVSFIIKPVDFFILKNTVLSVLKKS